MEPEKLKKMIEERKSELSIMEHVALLSLYIHRIGVFNILEDGIVESIENANEEGKQLFDSALVGIRQVKSALEIMQDVMGLDEDKPDRRCV
jgi:hypothetical protein